VASSSGTGGNAKMLKNTPGNRVDEGWKHGVSVDRGIRKIKCKFYERVINGEIYWFKHHLAGTKKDVGECTSVRRC